jgi:hypothetical protein
MNLLPEDPVRLRDQHDQSELVERIASQAARDLADSARLTSTALARIGDRIDAGRSKNPEPLRLGWVLMVGAFLLGIATAASAAHLDLLPRWLTRNVQGKPKLSHLATPGVVKARPFAGKDQPTLPASWATPGESNDGPSANPIPESAPVPMPAPVERARVAPDRSAEVTARHDANSLPKKRLGSGLRKPASVAMLDDGPGTSSAPIERPSPIEHPSVPPYVWPAGSPVLPAENAEQPPTAVPLPPLSAAAKLEQQNTAIPRQTVPASPALPAKARADEGSVGRKSGPEISAASHANRYLKEIVQALRIDHSPNQALALLDRHASELAGNAFAEESLLLRVEAMLALGQRSAVLRLLDGTSLTNVAASRALLVIRGELRAAVNRCAEGIGDFDMVLAEGRRLPKQALLGRARCKQKLGDTAGANADFDRYRREFPDDPLP